MPFYHENIQKKMFFYLLRLTPLLLGYWRQGILSIPGITGYEWVPARIGPFYK